MKNNFEAIKENKSKRIFEVNKKMKDIEKDIDILLRDNGFEESCNTSYGFEKAFYEEGFTEIVIEKGSNEGFYICINFIGKNEERENLFYIRSHRDIQVVLKIHNLLVENLMQ